jgi:hypothetical protein
VFGKSKAKILFFNETDDYQVTWIAVVEFKNNIGMVLMQNISSILKKH